MVYSIVNYGAISDGKTLCTEAIQNAIDECHKSGGGRVLIPSGKFYSGSFFLRDNVELHFELGALLIASENIDDYNPDDAYPQNYGWEPEGWRAKHLIMAIECNNVAITGYGTIDGSGDSFRGEPVPAPDTAYGWMYGTAGAKDKKTMRPGQLICFIESKNVVVEGITVRNAPCWCVFLHGCEYVRVHSIQVFNSKTALNTDGIDIDCCRYVTVSDCNIETGDDAITFRCVDHRLRNPRPCEYVTVTNCNLAVSASAFRIGVGSGIIRHIRVSNVTVERCANAIHFMTSYQGNGAAKIEDVNFFGFSIASSGSPIKIEGDRAFLKNVTIENLRANSISKICIIPNTECDISNILLKNIELYVRRDERELTAARRAVRGEYMLYIGTARNVVLDNVSVYADDDVKSLWTAKFYAELPDEVVIKDCKLN